MNYKERIESDYQTMLGKPVIKGTRVTVELLLRKLSEGATIADFAGNVSSSSGRGCYGCSDVCIRCAGK